MEKQGETKTEHRLQGPLQSFVTTVLYNLSVTKGRKQSTAAQRDTKLNKS